MAVVKRKSRKDSTATTAALVSPLKIPKSNIKSTSSLGIESEDEYEVEEIVDKRIGSKGNIEYLLKWVGYPSSENTWESVENMDCQHLVKKFEEQRQSRQKNITTAPSWKKSRQNTASAGTVGSPRKPIIRNDWEDRVARIDTVTRTEDGKLLVWIEWTDGEISEESAEEANSRCPQKMIQFYESRLKFPGDKH